MTRSRMNGMMAQKSTRFIGCLKKRHLRGEQMKRTRYSTMKKRTAQFSGNTCKYVRFTYLYFCT